MMMAEAASENEKGLIQRLVHMGSTAHARSRFCTECGARLDEHDLFCTECGAKVDVELGGISGGASACPAVSSDRMASILETAKIKQGKITDEMRSALHKRRTGDYVFRGAGITMHLMFDEIAGESIHATMKADMSDGSSCTVTYSGTIHGDDFSMHVTGKNLHPAPKRITRESGSLEEETTVINVTQHVSGSFVDDGVTALGTLFRRCG